ncbi:uncharacterized protein TrAFT101_004788 [Trichoderma asperellum]|uniref:uncharacterized protein n=1 Tax=Trichoderma asperellum TaxID=101201 RepID=UPI00332E5D20|nr:hypothetical protein TrAFT101_004788 [Trichoderma asperellum]
MRSMANDRANLRPICSPTSAMMDGIWWHGLCEASSPVTPRHQLECKSNALTLGYCRATRPIQSHPGVAGVHDAFSVQPLVRILVTDTAGNTQRTSGKQTNG